MKLNKFYLNKSAKLIDLITFEDKRGFFRESFSKKKLYLLGIKENFLQINHSFNKNSNTIRGLHFQFRPYSQAKIVYVISGSIFDVFVDLRKKAKFYGKINMVKLNSRKPQLLYVPKFCAHGFCTLEKNTNVIYYTSTYYNQNKEHTIDFADNFLKIKWPNKKKKIYISNKDLQGDKFLNVKF